jgi:hypothetical protein
MARGIKHNKAVKPVPLRSTGQNLSSPFVVLLRKIFPQKGYLNSAVYRNVRISRKGE